MEEGNTTKRIKMDSEIESRNPETEAVEAETEWSESLALSEDNSLSESLVERDVTNEKLQKSTEKSDLQPGRCQFFLMRKKRHCRSLPPNGKKYCVEHSHILGEESSKKRIPCPLDPKHTCYEDQLKKHLKKCNSREQLQLVYFSRGINAGDMAGADIKDNKVSIREVSDDLVVSLAKTVQRLHKEYVSQLKTEILFHDVMKEEAEKPTNGVAAQKHIQQQASLIGHLDRHGLLGNNRNVVEFGAGKGGLSHWVQLAMKDAAGNKYFLVDKSSVRYKMDNYHKRKDQGPAFERLKIDIENLDLGKVSDLQEGHQPIIGIGKHLCGGATDLMLRCLMETGLLVEGTTATKTKLVQGLVLALCCHHRCDWKTYVGKRFFTETCGLTAREFSLVTSLTSWATCASRMPEKQKTDDKDGAAEDSGERKEEYHHPRYGSLTPDEREAIGRQCKQLLDMGRVHYLRSHGLDVELLYYIDRELTLENMAIVAKRGDPSSPVEDDAAAASV